MEYVEIKAVPGRNTKHDAVWDKISRAPEGQATRVKKHASYPTFGVAMRKRAKKIGRLLRLRHDENFFYAYLLPARQAEAEE